MAIDQDRFALVSRRVSLDGSLRPAAVLVCGARIEAVVDPAFVPPEYRLEDRGELAVLPGLVDSHVHVNEPGRTEWEGFQTATRAAAAGGITAIADMPLNCIPVTTTLDAFQTKLAAIDGLLNIDCAFWGGVVPGNTSELSPMIDAGVAGFKCFLIHSGIDEFPNVTYEDLLAAMPVLAERGVPLLVHAELDTGDRPGQEQSGNPRAYSTYLASRPHRWETEAIAMMVELARKTGCRVHIVHLSSAEALATIARAKADGLPISAETCPHYLTLFAESVADGDTRFKCAPPIRERENADRLWSGLAQETIDFVVSDHSPCTPELKLLNEGDFTRAWGGISSLQFGLPAVWTEARQRGHGLAEMARWMSAGPAGLIGLSSKGAIEPGYDADLVVFDPDATFSITPESIHHRHKLTPHDGKILHGQVIETYLRGRLVYDRGSFPCPAAGQPLFPSGESRQCRH